MIGVSKDSTGADGTVAVTKLSNAPPSESEWSGDRSERSTVNVAVLGATGSIGTSTAEVIAHLNQIDPENGWRLWAASGHSNLEVLEELVGRAARDGAAPQRVILSDPSVISPQAAAERFGTFGIQVDGLRFGAEQLVDAARDPQVDVVVAAIVGRAGLESTVAAVQAGKRVALANKETLVVAGGLVSEQAANSGGQLLPVDSEHSAIWQCIADSPSPARRLILTASGGPFRSASAAEMRDATPEDALAHPTWQMGRKISIDSATMMNKALEIIEARWLFDVSADQIEVMIHPQSIIHSMVEFQDGSVLAQLSPPDMRLPIQYALTHPRRLACPAPPLDRRQSWDLSLEPADLERFPALTLGFEVARVGGTAGAVVNAANEVAVGLFLSGEIRFTDIVPLCQKTLENHTFEQRPCLARLLELDHWARQEARRCAERL
ncbi:1-deoxy-D-xylulose 5-phosphate reductoisomerase [Stieleria maiorica]|uniref:1-deoxy-D-xylulose 5-phosphate reductoisomerase n=1 Tax=Stieleria maiorica TaxID=2795974 RepID=A0A5B9ME27_9BACT|nr:1-deoxy-D-xylulose 5-phosphate reductoisomerase [Stieleria maiorica]